LKVVILAAGEGKRMRPLTAARPKVMLPIANRPIMEHTLLELKKAGISDFIFVVGYGSDQVRGYFGDGSKWDVSIQYSEQRKQLGTADALRNVAGTVNGNFLVINGDVIVLEADITALMQSERSMMSVIEVADPEGLGVVEVDGDRVTGIHEKAEHPPTNLANAALYLFTPAIFDCIQRTQKSPRGEYELTDSLKLLMDTEEGLYHRVLSSWLDMSYPWDLLQANESMLNGISLHNLGMVEAGATMNGVVVIGENTVVRSGAYIVGPVIIGSNCDIGPNCFIRPSTAIGNGCHIGNGVEIKNSIIMNGSKVPHLSYVGDSVIGENCNFGAGTKFANLRLDKQNIRINGIDTGRRKLGAIVGDNVQTGINVSLNVGTIIGHDSFIGPGAVISGELLPNSRIL
jgi:UDP-N-acetylglucosamine diphosphorylase/glucosamine-1-phosphate N-acetyltransferase